MNKFIFLGRISKDLEVRNTTNGTQVTVFDIAVNRQLKGTDGERQVDFFHITSFGKMAEFISKYFSKGQQILIEGRLQNRTWEDQTGAKRYATDYIAEHAEFAGSKQEKQINDVSQIVDNNDGEYITIDDNADLPF